jgi:hypothetical protein
MISRFVPTLLMAFARISVGQNLVRQEIMRGWSVYIDGPSLLQPYNLHRNQLEHPFKLLPLPTSAFAKMNTTNPSTQTNLSVVDDDSKELAIIFGTLATIIGAAGLGFAAFTWARSRGHQCEPNVKTDRNLESNELGPEIREAYELEGAVVADTPVAVAWSVITKFTNFDRRLLFLVLIKT